MKRSLASAIVTLAWLALAALWTDPVRADSAAVASYRPNMSELEQERLLNDTDNSCPKDDDNNAFNQTDAGWPDQANGTRASLVRQKYSQSNYLISSAGTLAQSFPLAVLFF